jgi:malate dehydrogenase (oxaloacetate-decarboxylating)(NADP+)
MTWGELAVLRALKDPIDRYVYLRDLRAVDEPGFFRLLTAHSYELLPIVYTPTVGDAALSYHALPITPQGLYVTSDDVGHVADVLAAWPHKVRVVRHAPVALGGIATQPRSRCRRVAPTPTRR